MNVRRRRIGELKVGDKFVLYDGWTETSIRGTVQKQQARTTEWIDNIGQIFTVDNYAEVEVESRDLWYEVFDIVNRTWNQFLSEDDRKHHAVYTLITEAAEVADCVKKGKYSPRHNGVLDVAHLTEEIGDVMYGIVAVCIEFGINPEDAVNILREKLAKRYA